MENIISMNNMSLIKENRAILKDINWEVNEKEHWAILGLNGSGKTSILNIVTGYQYPTKGEVSVLGTLPTKSGKHTLSKFRHKKAEFSFAEEIFGFIFFLFGV